MIEFRHIAVEGVPGSGKTALAQALASRLGARLLLDADDNPFLESFHADMSARAFQAQLFFLLSRYRKEDRLRQPELFEYNVITDYLFDRDEIYASVTLNEDERVLYGQLHALLGSRRTLPDLVVFLQLTMKESELRADGIEPAFMRVLNQAYNDYFFSWSRTPLLVVRADSFQPAIHEAQLDDLVAMIEKHPVQAGATGTVYYTPLSGAARKP